MTNSRLTLAALASSALAASALVLAGGPALASHGGGGGAVVQTGTCSSGAHWKVKAKADDGRIEVEGEVDSNVSGQTWAWKVRDNGVKVAKGHATTGGRSGSFSVEPRIADGAGTDTITFKAKHAGQVCKGTVSL